MRSRLWGLARGRPMLRSGLLTFTGIITLFLLFQAWQGDIWATLGNAVQTRIQPTPSELVAPTGSSLALSDVRVEGGDYILKNTSHESSATSAARPLNTVPAIIAAAMKASDVKWMKDMSGAYVHSRSCG